MKKLILFVLTIITALTILIDTHAYETGTNVLTNNTYTITYTSAPLGSSGQAIKISIAFNGDAIGYDTLVVNGIYNVSYIYDTSHYVSGIGQGYSADVSQTDYDVYYLGVTQPILRPANVVKTLIEPIKANTVLDLYYFYNPVGDNYNQAVSAIKSTVSIVLITGGQGYNEGYRKALEDSELYYSNQVQQMQDTIDYEKTISYESARNYYAIFYNGQWLTAEEYGDIRFGDGYDTGLNNEIDWFSWSMTFFLMPFRIMNIQVLPGIRIGYFALFSLLLGVVGWFFFIVGKGGGRRK